MFVIGCSALVLPKADASRRYLDGSFTGEFETGSRDLPNAARGDGAFWCVHGIRPCARISADASPRQNTVPGNDRHRDWPTLVAAVKGWDDCRLRIASATIDRRLVENAPSIEIVRPKRNEELLSLYDWADIAVVPLRSNLHASGITVVEEAITRGNSRICTDTGGLTAYFTVDEVKYVPEGQPGAIREAIIVLANDDRGRDAMVKRAQARVISAGLTSRDFARRHAELSRELLAFSDEAVPERKLSFGCALFLAAVMTVSLSLDAQAAPTPAKRLDLCAFDPTFTEDFDTLSVSPHGENGSRWIAHTPWNGDFGDAAFADPGRDFPFRVKNGVLEIEARKDADGKWQSGLLASVTPTGSGFSQRYGYFEMRAQLPPGPGTWPAFWLNSVLPQGSQQPGVEIDVIEYYGQFNDAYHSTVHIWDNVRLDEEYPDGSRHKRMAGLFGHRVSQLRRRCREGRHHILPRPKGDVANPDATRTSGAVDDLGEPGDGFRLADRQDAEPVSHEGRLHPCLRAAPSGGSCLLLAACRSMSESRS